MILLCFDAFASSFISASLVFGMMIPPLRVNPIDSIGEIIPTSTLGEVLSREFVISMMAAVLDGI